MVRNRGSSERHPSSLGDGRVASEEDEVKSATATGDRHLARFIPRGYRPSDRRRPGRQGW